MKSGEGQTLTELTTSSTPMANAKKRNQTAAARAARATPASTRGSLRQVSASAKHSLEPESEDETSGPPPTGKRLRSGTVTNGNSKANQPENTIPESGSLFPPTPKPRPRPKLRLPQPDIDNDAEFGASKSVPGHLEQEKVDELVVPKHDKQDAMDHKLETHSYVPLLCANMLL